MKYLLLFIPFVSVSCGNKQNGITTEGQPFMQSSNEPYYENNPKTFFRDDIFAPEELRGAKNEPEFRIEKVK